MADVSLPLSAQHLTNVALVFLPVCEDSSLQSDTLDHVSGVCLMHIHQVRP